MVNKNAFGRTFEGNLKGGSSMDFIEAKKAAIGHLLEVFKCTYNFSSENISENREIGSISEMASSAIYELVDIPQAEKKFDFELSDSIDGFIFCYIDGEMTKEQVCDHLVNWLDHYKRELSSFHEKLQII